MNIIYILQPGRYKKDMLEKGKPVEKPGRKATDLRHA
jgi:hypothetical protein